MNTEYRETELNKEGDEENALNKKSKQNKMQNNITFYHAR